MRSFQKLKPTKETVKGTICLSTGTGKSKVAIDFIKEDKSISDVLITSPRTNLKENWRKELEKWGFSQWSDTVWSVKGRNGKAVNITIENVQTCYKWEKKKFDLVIADEIHTMMTPEYSQLFDNNMFRYVMGLTATHDITSKNDKEQYYNKYAPIIYEYYDSAKDGLINKTRFFIVDHELSNKDKIIIKLKDKQFEKGEADHYKYLSERIKTGQQLMLQQGSDNWFNDAGEWFWKKKGTPKQKYAAMMYLNSIKYRKHFLQNLPSTALLARRIKDGIINADQNNKVLTFSELTDQANRITKNTVHSHNTEDVNKQRMDDFNKGVIRDLGSCQSLTLGLNLKGATHAIMESYVGSSTRSRQKKGRLDRLAIGEVADMWIIRVKGTQSEKWFDTMTSDMIEEGSKVIYLTSEDILNERFDFKTSTIRK